MENTYIILIIIASFVYNIYSNYKKEQKKQAQRTPKRVPIPNYTNTTKSLKKSKSQEKVVINQEYVVNDIPEEVLAVQKKRQIQQEPKKRLEVSNQEQNEYLADFDLKRAVINQAILERPYK